MFVLLTCSPTVAKNMFCQCSKYMLMSFKCVLKLAPQCLLMLFVYTALALYIISLPEKLEDVISFNIISLMNQNYVN